MDTNRIKNVALGARAQLMAATEMALDRVLAMDSRERVSRPTDVSRIEDAIASRGSDGRDKVIEQVAYTWFNRLCALRYMDVRGYTPVGIVSPRSGETLPAILADARRGIYAPGLDISTESQREVSDIIDGTTAVPDPLGHAFVKLLLAACSMYARSMDYLFGTGRDLGPAIELLAPTDLLSEGSLLQRICAGLDEATCNEGVEVMGWLYQFYVSERKDAFFASKKKATAADIAPATQLFTPNWIVRYLVENSLGRLWMLNFPDSELKDHMDYYVEPEDPEDDFLKIYSPEDITFLDPACGSGHILVYAFDLLYLMYEEEGYRPADIPELILKNNLTGVEIDDRAAEIASFCLEMKALEKDSEFLSKDVDASVNVTHVFEPHEDERQLVPTLCSDTRLMNLLAHFNEIGSLAEFQETDDHVIRMTLEGLANNGSLNASTLRLKLEDLKGSIGVLRNRYSVVVTNPPYMSSGGMNQWLSSWIRAAYPKAWRDLCTSFIQKSISYTLKGGYAALITMQSWMFLASFEALREELLTQKSIVTMAHLGTHAFEAIGGEVVSTTATVFLNTATLSSADYYRLEGLPEPDDKRTTLLAAISGTDDTYHYKTAAKSFFSVPSQPISYWMTSSLAELFKSKPSLGEWVETKQGLKSSKDDLFFRLWPEISYDDIDRTLTRIEDAASSDKKWLPLNKGGHKRWYGDNTHVINWEDDGREIKAYAKKLYGSVTRTITSIPYYLRRCISWPQITKSPEFRVIESGYIFNAAGPSMFVPDDMYDYILGLLNSSVCQHITYLLNPTTNLVVTDMLKLPFIIDDSQRRHIEDMVSDSIELSKSYWDDGEFSWDFTWHPLVPSHREWVDKHTYDMHAAERKAGVERIEMRFRRWERDCRERFDQLKANEEELNRIFAQIYNMEDEVPIEVPDDKISVRLADLGRDIRSLVSYGVGCMFGRYSLDEPGLILADEGSTLDDYHAKVPNPSFEPDRTGIIPITEFDYPFFGDDIVAQFRRWLAAAYGEDTLGENIAFIEKALGKSLRAYFARDFYNDHIKTYQKRPIYWLFSSPKRGLQALVYLHRYTPQTVATLLADYVRPLRDNLGAQARLLEVSGKAKDASLAAKYDATVAELDAWEHDVIFPLAQRHVELDLDDGVKANYGKPEFKGALRKVVGLN